MTALERHYEAHLGLEPADVWKTNGGVVVARFDATPRPGLVTFATVGLSAHSLRQPRGNPIRQELIATTKDRFAAAAWPDLLARGSGVLRHTHKAFLRCELVSPLEPFDAAYPDMTGVICVPPGWFDTAFGLVEDPSDSPIVVVELLPITSDEVARARRESVQALLEADMAGELDLYDLSRGS